MLKPSGLIILIIAILLGGYLLYNGGCNGQVLLGPSLPQEPGNYFLANGHWENVSKENFSDDGLAYGFVTISLDDFNNDAVSLRSGSKLEWYTKYTSAELSYLNDGLFGAMTQESMASAVVYPLIVYESYDGRQDQGTLRSAAGEDPVAGVVVDKSDLSKGYTWYAFSVIPSPGKYVIFQGRHANPVGCIVVN
ncbi:MAG: hypothetical protein V1719_01250 [Patescibacteria group bacterium]